MPPSGGAVKTTLKFTPLLAGKLVGCLMLGLLGMYYLYKGKENQDVSGMIKGAALVLLSLFIFF